MKKLYLIITDYNGQCQTQKCMQAISNSRYRDFTVVIVDHGTAEETRSMLAAEYPEVIRLSGSPDLWWAGATNLGIKFAIANGADAVILINNDCYVTPDTIQILVELACKYSNSIIAPIQRDWRTGKVTTIKINSLFILGFPTLTGPQRLASNVQDKDVIPVKLIRGGRGVYIPSNLLNKIGFFDEKRLPHYYSDHDFYLRAVKLKIPLYIATQTFVDIDDTRTTLANRPCNLSFTEFLRTLHDIRSHRNLRYITILFRKHYPVPGFYPFGVALYTFRYFLVYLFKRAGYLFSQRQQ
jgi:GT2 family glycosyltransferase